VRFDPSGQVLWGERFGDAGADDAVGIGVDAAGDLVLTGRFAGAIDFGGAPLYGSSSNVYLAKLGEGSMEPILSITVLPRAGAIEAQWDISSRWTLERFFVLRDNSSRTEPKIVAAGTLGPSSGVLMDRDVAPGETYRYELVVTTPTGVQFRSPVVTTTVPVYTTQLSQNFPNPFNPRTSISYVLAARADVALVIFDVSGTLVRRIDQGPREAGEYVVEWDGRDDAGNAVGSGVYFYRLEGISGVAPRKMVLLK
ncbi:MAG TPA: FlgD immunoglobulin-like domain containing protein, partial [Candidatus Krumholzibacteria bacterium]|nr:FlgD immunoglobulin-like domain containing protein [Candidatus Krumholzibacteria bacterium]